MNCAILLWLNSEDYHGYDDSSDDDGKHNSTDDGYNKQVFTLIDYVVNNEQTMKPVLMQAIWTWCILWTKVEQKSFD